jgi:hypothetical protein
MSARPRKKGLDEMSADRLYQQHLKALASMKPSINSHQEPPKKFEKSRGKKRRIFNGSKLANREKVPDIESMSARSEPEPSLGSIHTATAKAELRSPRRAQTSRATRPKQPLCELPPNVMADPETEVICTRGEECETESGSFEPEGEGVSFGADMWDTSDEAENDPDCFDLEFEDLDF